MRISDWSSDVCSSDLPRHGERVAPLGQRQQALRLTLQRLEGAGKGSGRLLVQQALEGFALLRQEETAVAVEGGHPPRGVGGEPLRQPPRFLLLGVGTL